VTFKVSMFKCKLVNNNTSVRTNDYEFTLMDQNKVGYKYKPFILAHQKDKYFMSIIHLMTSSQHPGGKKHARNS